MTIKQRDIVLVSFPFSDFEINKVRPALVISNDHYNNSHNDVVVCAITTSSISNEFKVVIPFAELLNGGLPKQSYVRVDKPFSILSNKVLKIQATISEKLFKEIKSKINELI